jgi:hypothetical protein
MNQLSPIGLYSKGFTLLLSTRLYSLIIRAQLEYGLAITKITSFLVTQIKDAQNLCKNVVTFFNLKFSYTFLPFLRMPYSLASFLTPIAQAAGFNGTCFLSPLYGNDVKP